MNSNEITNSAGLIGLHNLGNTCYLNSIIQVLAHTEALRDILFKLTKKDLKGNTKETRVLLEWINLVYHLWNSNQNALTPHRFKRVISVFYSIFRGTNQEDAHESYTFLLEMLHNALSKPVNIQVEGEAVTEFDKLMVESIKSWEGFFGKEYSDITQLFYTQLHSTTRCSNQDCNYISHIWEPTSSISMHLPHGKMVGGQMVTIENCLKNYMLQERLDKNNLWLCEKCNKKVPAIKRLTIWYPSDILVFHFKRFNNRNLKIPGKIYYPETLDIKDYVEGEPNGSTIYNLYGVVCHSGSTPKGGHYYSFCKVRGEWYLFNDSIVRKMNIETIIKQEAYMLFYTRLNK